MSSEIRWLVAAEAALFMSLSYWEPIASYGRPLVDPLSFWIVLIGGATVATLACHLGPALFAAKFGPWTTRWRWILVAWLAGGLIEWWHSLTVPVLAGMVGQSWAISVFVFAGFVGLVPRAARGVIGVVLLTSSVILVWSFATTTEGWHVAARHQFLAPDELKWWFARGLLTAAAPAVAIAYRIGKIVRRPSQILISGLVGVWCPMVAVMALAAVAVDAGANLHWKPSLPIGIAWALVGISRLLGSATFVVVTLTLLGPAVVAVDCVRDLFAANASWKGRFGLLAVASGVAWVLQWAYRSEELGSLILTPQLEAWATTVWMLGAVAGVYVLAKRSSGGATFWTGRRPVLRRVVHLR